MSFICLFLLFGPLIETKADRTVLTTNQELHVDIEFSRPPELFPLIYSIFQSPASSFQVASYDVINPKHLRFTLQPMHTGELIFAPGVASIDGERWLIPAISVECVSSGLTNLAVPQLSPLYPERRIDLNPLNRLYLLNQERLQNAQQENKKAYRNFRLAWNGLAYGIGALAFGLLAVWAIVYYELLARAKKPKTVPQTELEKLVAQVKDDTLPESVRWQKLAALVREALGARTLSLEELEEHVAISRTLTSNEKKILVPAIQTLGAISYAGRPASEEEWRTLCQSLLGLLVSRS
ncbi:MAG: hypothetical protein JSR37_09525 [Verrucomicrobia bacterium]|nr:hypothetical protein [Verrucomicrobiota bacterium]MBS0637505.1 hypothetical protein [Verrucomicrobiota bacterium]